MTIPNASPSHPWYRQFWPWFLLILPGTVVVAGIGTLILAIRHSDNLVVDNYYKEGLAINRYLAQDELARKLKLNASITIDDKADLQLGIDGLSEPADHLILLWQHPTSETRDFKTVLIRDNASHYSAQLDHVPQGRWYLTLENRLNGDRSAGHWRLNTEVFLQPEGNGQQRIRLSAAD